MILCILYFCWYSYSLLFPFSPVNDTRDNTPKASFNGKYHPWLIPLSNLWIHDYPTQRACGNVNFVNIRWVLCNHFAGERMSGLLETWYGSIGISWGRHHISCYAVWWYDCFYYLVTSPIIAYNNHNFLTTIFKFHLYLLWNWRFHLISIYWQYFRG